MLLLLLWASVASAQPRSFTPAESAVLAPRLGLPSAAVPVLAAAAPETAVEGPSPAASAGGQLVEATAPARPDEPVAATQERAGLLFDGGAHAALEAKDDTQRLKAHMKGVRDGSAGPLPPKARDFHYIFVPGFGWDGLFDYFGPNRRHLERLGLTTSFVVTDPLATSGENAESVRRAIEASAKPVVLIGHSKGGRDSLEALRLHPRLQGKVARLLMIQSPVRGSALAAWFAARPWVFATGLFTEMVFKPWRLFWGNPFFYHATVRQLARPATPLIDPHPGLKIFSIATRVTDDTKAAPPLQYQSSFVSSLSGKDNDAVVGAEEAVAPGSRYAVLDHVAHGDTVSDPSNRSTTLFSARGHDPFFAARLTEAAVRWMFGAGE